MPRFDHVIFDLDGTLADTRDDLVGAVNHVRQLRGRAPLPAAAVIGYVGEGARRLIERALADAPAEIESALEEFRRYYSHHLLDHTRAYPGIPALLERARAGGATFSVLTNKPEAMSRAILDGLDLLRYFAAVLGGDSLSVRKPDPAGVLHLARIAAVPTDRLLLVGDSPIDVRTARAARVVFCGVAWGFAPEAMAEEHPERIVALPIELLAVIDPEGGSQ